jgi:hypothetical protein
MRLLKAAAALVLLAEGARVAWTGKSGDFAPVEAAIRRLAAGQPLYLGNPDGPAYVYSPLVALLLAPLHVLPPMALRFAWYAGSWAVLIAAWHLATRLAARDVVAAPAVRALAAAAVLYFAYYNALNGQAMPHMLALVLLAETLDRRGRPRTGGLALAASLLIKPFPVLLLLYYALRRRRAIVGSTLACAALGLLLPAVYFGAGYPAVLRAWWDVNRQQQHLYDITSWAHQSITSAVYRLAGRQNPAPFSFDAHDPAAMGIAAALLGLLAISAAAALRSRGSLVQENAAFGLFLLDWALLPPTSWKHYYLVLLFPAAFVAVLATGGTRWRRLAAWTLGALVLGQLLMIVIKPKAAPFLVYELSICVWLALAAFLLLARVALAADPPDRVAA